MFAQFHPSINNLLTTVSSLYPITEAFLFGSWAYGIPRESSDIDIAIILDQEISSDMESNIFSIAQDIDVKFDTHVFSKEYFAKARRQIVYEIKEKGIKLR